VPRVNRDFRRVKEHPGDFFLECLTRRDSLAIGQPYMNCKNTARPCGKEPLWIRNNPFVAHNGHGHSMRLFGLTRRLDTSLSPIT
jgi:hypothetical protein